MTVPRKFVLFLALCAGAACLCADPKVLLLDSGERVLGKLLEKATDDYIYVQSGLLGELAIPRARVVKIEDKPVNEKTPGQESIVAKKNEKSEKPKIAVAEKEIALTEEELYRIEELTFFDSLRDFKAPDYWSGNFRIGLNVSSGDREWTETFIRGKLEIKPKSSPNFFRFNGSYTYRETIRSNEIAYKSTDKFDASFIYRHRFYENWFVQNALGYRVDQIKGIDRELQESIGVGYKFRPSSQFEFLLGGGGGLEDFEANFKDNRDGLNSLLNVFQEATWKPFNRTSFVQKFNYYWNPENTEQFNYLVSAAIRFRLTDLIGLEFSYKKDFDNDTGRGNSQDDTQWRNALVVYF